jgi:hypothetical protein
MQVRLIGLLYKDRASFYEVAMPIGLLLPVTGIQSDRNNLPSMLERQRSLCPNRRDFTRRRR